jgi:dimethylargininase
MREPTRTYATCVTGITLVKARKQHQRLRGIYRRHGYRVELLPASYKYEASTFTQDTAFLAGDQALLTNCMSDWRTKEARHLSHLRKVLTKYVDVVGQMGLPAELDVGEVVKTDTEYLVGISKKTARHGVKQIRERMDLDLPIRTVQRVDDGMAHLGSGLSYLGDNTLLATEFFYGYRFLDRYKVVWAPMEEENGANAVRLTDGTLIVSSDAPHTVWQLRERGFDVETVDLSQYNKGNGHISCLSINIAL